MEAARDLTHDLVSRDWQEYADDCFCHDPEPCVVNHAQGLAHTENHPMVLATTASTS